MRKERGHSSGVGDVGFCSAQITGFDSLKACLVILFLLTFITGECGPVGPQNFQILQLIVRGLDLFVISSYGEQIWYQGMHLVF